MTNAQWFAFIQSNYKAGYYTAANVAVFVVKGKITADQFQQITGQTYTA